jgi:uncharacterized protein (DUF2062 family)
MNWRALVEKLAGSDASPRRTAAAFAFGTFLSFSPFIGLQIATGMAVAFLLRLNRPAVLVGLCTNLPWIIVPWYTLTTYVGSSIVKQPIGADFGARLSALLELPFYRAAFWERAFDLAAPFFWSFVVGSTLGAMVVGIGAYVVTVPLLVGMKRRV